MDRAGSGSCERREAVGARSYRCSLSVLLPPLRPAAAAACLAPALALALALPADAASSTSAAEPLYLLGIPVDFILFGATLLGVAVFHHRTLQVALTGLA